jgi:hypothetical protein
MAIPAFQNETISRIMGRQSMLWLGKEAARELPIFDLITANSIEMNGK